MYWIISKQKLDLDRERAKIDIDRLSDNMIRQLETYEKQFIQENSDNYIDLGKNSQNY